MKSFRHSRINIACFQIFTLFAFQRFFRELILFKHSLYLPFCLGKYSRLAQKFKIVGLCALDKVFGIVKLTKTSMVPVLTLVDLVKFQQAYLESYSGK